MSDVRDDLHQLGLLLRFTYGRLCRFEDTLPGEMSRLLLVAPEA